MGDHSAMGRADVKAGGRALAGGTGTRCHPWSKKDTAIAR